MATELTNLEKHFVRWRAGEIDPFELDLMHRFHDGPGRELYKRHTSGDGWMCAAAIFRGIVRGNEVDREVGAALERHLAFLRAQEEETGRRPVLADHLADRDLSPVRYS